MPSILIRIDAVAFYTSIDVSIIVFQKFQEFQTRDTFTVYVETGEA